MTAFSDMISALCAEVHAANVEAGWWPQDKGQRNRGEVMMLIVSELGEASVGALDDAQDDHLPHLPMFAVELADTAIRLMDLLGADMDAFDVGSTVDEAVPMYEVQLAGRSVDEKLMAVVRNISHAMEAHRKGRVFIYVTMLSHALATVIAIARLHDVNLFDIVAQKREYNAVRADHKLENRAKPGGKAY